MSYGFYQFARFTALIGFGLLAYNAHTETKETQMFIYGSLALLFQPFFKITLGKDIWNIVDVIVAIALITSLSLQKKKST